MKEFLRGFTLTGWLVIVLLIVLVTSLSYCAYDANRDARAARERAQANGATYRAETASRDEAGSERLSDAQSNADLNQDLTHATAHLPDAVPSDRRIALHCQRMRQAGTDTAAVPACR